MKITITEEKKEKLSECTEKILRYAGKLMSCIERLDEDDDDDEYGERDYRMGMRDDDDDPSMRRYGERGGRGSNMRYRRY
ncbi:MAG: hypothetical protein MJZ81_06145 [Bacteroidales bacterium]|nr:hypothetical protein [Bacteroidales bacterium]